MKGFDRVIPSIARERGICFLCFQTKNSRCFAGLSMTRTLFITLVLDDSRRNPDPGQTNE